MVGGLSLPEVTDPEHQKMTRPKQPSVNKMINAGGDGHTAEMPKQDNHHGTQTIGDNRNHQ